MSGFQVMPPLTSEERAELEASIVESGVQVPILVSADGTIVDGHHRDEIARKHNLHCPRTVSGKSEQELRGLAFSLNLHRRHLTREQKRQIVAESIKADPQLSDREHAKRTGASPSTAGAVRRDLEESGQVSNLDSRVSGDGRVRPATQPPRQQTTFTDEAGEEIGGIVDDRDPAEMTEADWIDDAYDSDALSEEIEAEFLNEPHADLSTVAKPKRRPITEAFDSASYELRRAVERVVRLTEDDRLQKNRDQISGSNLSDLVRVRDAINGVINTLEG